MVKANQISTIDIYTQKKEKQSKYNTKDSHQITREKNKRNKRKKDLQKQTKQLTKW